MSRALRIQAIFYTLGATFSLVLMAVAARELKGQLTTYEIMVYRSALGLIVILGAGFALGRLSEISFRRFDLHLTRNIFHFSAQNLWLYAIFFIPLSQVFAFEFTTPLWVAIAASVFLGERSSPLRWAYILIGFIGVLIAGNPDFSTVNFATFAAFLCAIGFAGTSICTKKLTSSESLIAIIFWLVTLQLIFSLLTSLWFFKLALPSARDLPYVLLIGLGGLSSHVCIAAALARADVSFLSPIDFVRLPLITIIGYLLYQEELSWAIFIGSGLVLWANYMIITERKKIRR